MFYTRTNVGSKHLVHSILKDKFAHGIELMKTVKCHIQKKNKKRQSKSKRNVLVYKWVQIHDT